MEAVCCTFGCTPYMDGDDGDAASTARASCGRALIVAPQPALVALRAPAEMAALKQDAGQPPMSRLPQCIPAWKLLPFSEQRSALRL